MEKIKEVDLNEEAIKAGTHYLNKQGSGLPLKDQQDIVNYVSIGFFMGVRWHEEKKVNDKAAGT